MKSIEELEAYLLEEINEKEEEEEEEEAIEV